MNLRGQVIAINTAIASGAQNIGFAIPINRAQRDINSVKASGEIQTPFIGVRYILVTPEIAKSQKLPVEYGALVRGSDDLPETSGFGRAGGPAVTPDSPAAKAGIQAEDIILEFNGKKIDREHPLSDLIGQFGVGDTVTLKIHRGGKEMSVSVTLGKRPQH